MPITWLRSSSRQTLSTMYITGFWASTSSLEWRGSGVVHGLSTTGSSVSTPNTSLATSGETRMSLARSEAILVLLVPCSSDSLASFSNSLFHHFLSFSSSSAAPASSSAAALNSHKRGVMSRYNLFLSCDFKIAVTSGVSPMMSIFVTSALPSRSIFTMSHWPFMAEMCRGVCSRMFCMLMSARCSRRKRTADSFCLKTASWIGQ
mmetsp:Transcript_32309/g.82271  ORF Transcript_32309/g.82271 Transcript_32309/m.82271 type:complete len:205 (+) Transcript_32309:1963-2577(+)